MAESSVEPSAAAATHDAEAVRAPVLGARAQRQRHERAVLQRGRVRRRRADAVPDLLLASPTFRSGGLGPFSAYGWAAIIAGLFCILLALIFSSLTSVMPRSGGDYVFSSRILHPFLGWLESWTLVIA